jgi:hypothetical protein
MPSMSSAPHITNMCSVISLVMQFQTVHVANIWTYYPTSTTFNSVTDYVIYAYLVIKVIYYWN